ncbi:MFS general substrate transporter [Lecanosticta acicola]|uniref:MFS general substrate transporter n=1 Tax=Lecanosticta acicola TaxID=111012 RepID=A0AAI9ED29_9PEZI|nr:MFS general substrate transporter [Lecanosticta acicola]
MAHSDEDEEKHFPSQSQTAADLQSQKDDSSTTQDPNVVDRDGDTDPQNPRNWSIKTKIANTSLVTVLTLLTPPASSMFAPGVLQVLRDFRTTSATIAELVVLIYILGFAVGPLIISPLSEMDGRYPVYVVCNVMFLMWTIACAVVQSMPQLIVFRFLIRMQPVGTQYQHIQMGP